MEGVHITQFVVSGESLYVGGPQDHPQAERFTGRTHRTQKNSYAHDYSLVQQKDAD